MGVLHFPQVVAECKTERIAEVTSGPTMGQNRWKNGDIPSGPGDLEGCIWSRATRTSSSVYGISKERLISSVTTRSIELSTSFMCVGFEVINSL